MTKLGKAGRFYELTPKGKEVFDSIPKTSEGVPNFKELRRLAKDRPLYLHWVEHLEELWADENQSLRKKANEDGK